MFTKLDNSKFNIAGFSPINIFTNIRMWRHYIAFLTLLSLELWVGFGWEATWSQVGMYLQFLPSLLLGQISLGQVHASALGYYGLGQHLSSAVIYGAVFLLLSFHFEKYNIKKSMNFALSTLLTLFSVGLYEVIYNVLYSQLQSQYWAFSFVSKQGLNMWCFVAFIGLGAVSFVYLYALNFKPNFSKCTMLFLAGSIVTYLLWVFYPVSTSLTVGSWTSGALFPQTMYAVGPVDGVMQGVPYFVENNMLHLVNLLNKVFMALSVLNLCRIKRRIKV